MSGMEQNEHSAEPIATPWREWRPHSDGDGGVTIIRRTHDELPVAFKHPSVASLGKTSPSRKEILTKPGVYALTVHGAERIKIGFTTNLHERVHTLETGSPFPLTVLAFMPGDYALEARFHAKLARYRVHREWFRDVPRVRNELARVLALRGGVSILKERADASSPR